MRDQSQRDRVNTGVDSRDKWGTAEARRPGMSLRYGSRGLNRIVGKVSYSGEESGKRGKRRACRTQAASETETGTGA